MTSSSSELPDLTPTRPQKYPRPVLAMAPAVAPRDLAYATALLSATQRMHTAPDAATLWRVVLDEAVALIPADGAAVVTYRDRCWQTVAARPSDASPDDSAAAAAMEMLSRRALLNHPISVDDLAHGAPWVGLGWRSLLVLRIGGPPRNPARLIWYSARPAVLSPYLDVAGTFTEHAALAFQLVSERENLNRAIAAHHRVGLAQGVLMTRRHITAEKAFSLLQRHSQDSNVKLRILAQAVVQTGDLPYAMDGGTR